MPSLLAKALSASQGNGPPVPMGGGTSSMLLPGQASGANPDLTLIRTYKQNGTVFANLSLIASATAGPSWHLYRQQPQDGRVRYSTADKGSDQRTEVVQHAALNALNNPAGIRVGNVQVPAWTRFGLMEISNLWLETTGKSHWIVDLAEGSSIPLGLWPVRPDRMTPVPHPDNYLAGWIYTSPDGRERIPLLPTEVIFNRYPDPEDVYGGTGPLQSVLADIEAADMASQWNRNYFVNSAEPGGVLQVDHTLQDGEFNQLVNRWRETHRGVARSHRIAVLEAGVTYVPNPHTLKDMDFGNLREVMRDIIRESLGMHKIMTGVTDDVNRANAQTGEEIFAAWKVAPRLDRWKDVLNSQFLPLFGATGQGVEFDYVYPMPQNREADALELATKSTSALTLISAGYDPDDVLQVVGLPAMKVAEKAVQAPALPPAWVPEMPAAPAGPDDTDGQDDSAPAAILRPFSPWGALDQLQRQRAAWNSLTGAP